MDPKDLIETFGTLGLLFIIFAESGLLLGLVFPGDSLLFTAGLLASQGRLNIAVVVVGCFVAAVVGAEVGYFLGRRFGPALFRKPDSRMFKREYVERSREFFERHGAKTIVLARFVPFVRTLAPMLAGIGEMPRRTFVTYNIIGSLMWAVGVSVAGYFLGSTIPDIDRYLLPIIGLIIVLSLLFPAIELLRNRRRNRGAALVSAADAEAEAEELHEIVGEEG
jgi:membrane-associated protein